MTRSSKRRIPLPGGPSRTDRAALVEAMARTLHDVWCWRGAAQAGSSFVIFDTEVDGRGLYVQFLARPDEPMLLWEFASGFFGGSLPATAMQRQAMVAHGFSDGTSGNFQQKIACAGADDATDAAERTLRLLGDVFGWSPDPRIAASVLYERRRSGGAG